MKAMYLCATFLQRSSGFIFLYLTKTIILKQSLLAKQTGLAYLISNN